MKPKKPMEFRDQPRRTGNTQTETEDMRCCQMLAWPSGRQETLPFHHLPLEGSAKIPKHANQKQATNLPHAARFPQNTAPKTGPFKGPGVRNYRDGHQGFGGLRLGVRGESDDCWNFIRGHQGSHFTSLGPDDSLLAFSLMSLHVVT